MGIKLSVHIESEDDCATTHPKTTVLEALRRVCERITKGHDRVIEGKLLDGNGNSIGTFSYEKT